MQYPLISEIGFVALVSNIAGKVGPGYGVGTSDKIRMGDGPERFTNIGGVGDVAVCAEEYGAKTGCVGGIANVGVGGFVGAVDREDEQVTGSKDSNRIHTCHRIIAHRAIPRCRRFFAVLQEVSLEQEACSNQEPLLSFARRHL